MINELQRTNTEDCNILAAALSIYYFFRLKETGIVSDSNPILIDLLKKHDEYSSENNKDICKVAFNYILRYSNVNDIKNLEQIIKKHFLIEPVLANRYIKIEELKKILGSLMTSKSILSFMTKIEHMSFFVTHWVEGDRYVEYLRDYLDIEDKKIYIDYIFEKNGDSQLIDKMNSSIQQDILQIMNDQIPECFDKYYDFTKIIKNAFQYNYYDTAYILYNNKKITYWEIVKNLLFKNPIMLFKFTYKIITDYLYTEAKYRVSSKNNNDLNAAQMVNQNNQDQVANHDPYEPKDHIKLS